VSTFAVGLARCHALSLIKIPASAAGWPVLKVPGLIGQQLGTAVASAERMAKKAAKKTTSRKTTSRKATSRKTTSRKAASRKTASKGTRRKAAAKRELIDTGSDKRYVRRGAAGKFKESDDVGKSLSRDVPKKARTKAKRGQGDRGDR
jgi:hypothetical protein